MSYAGNDIAAQPVVVVSLDGSLLRGDLAVEAAFQLLKKNAFYLLLFPYWMLRGRDHFLSQVTRRINLDPGRLAYDDGLLDRLRALKAEGRRVALADTSVAQVGTIVAEHLGIFERVVTETPPSSRSGTQSQFDALFGSNGWTVWTAASVQTAEVRSPGWKTYLKALRPHQWLKNCLVFVPLVLAHMVLDPVAIIQALVAFLAFGLCASGVYVINDLVDLQDDRLHPTKRLRPFASGAIPLSHGVVIAIALLVSAFVVAAFLPLEFVAVLAVYLVMTMAYSFFFKRKLLWDVILLAALYTIRIVAGSAAIDIPRSFWLLTFSVFLFFSLAMIKRFVELKRSGTGLESRGRNYRIEDLEALSQFGIASGLISVLVLALYIDSPVVKTLYAHSEVIWLICPIMLYLIARVWILARRDEVPDDPVLFLMSDWRSQLAMAGAGLLLVFATL